MHWMTPSLRCRCYNNLRSVSNVVQSEQSRIWFGHLNQICLQSECSLNESCLITLYVLCRWRLKAASHCAVCLQHRDHLQTGCFALAVFYYSFIVCWGRGRGLNRACLHICLLDSIVRPECWCLLTALLKDWRCVCVCALQLKLHILLCNSGFVSVGKWRVWVVKLRRRMWVVSLVARDTESSSFPDLKEAAVFYHQQTWVIQGLIRGQPIAHVLRLQNSRHSFALSSKTSDMADKTQSDASHTHNETDTVVSFCWKAATVHTFICRSAHTSDWGCVVSLQDLNKMWYCLAALTAQPDILYILRGEGHTALWWGVVKWKTLW